MMKYVLFGSLMLLGLGSVATASEQEARAYCEDAVKVMQLEGEKAAAYVDECFKAKQAEEADD